MAKKSVYLHNSNMKKWAAKAAFLTLIAVFGLALVTRQVLAATKVSPSNMNGWAFQVDSSNGSGTFVTGPAPAPMGTGSAKLFTGTNGNQPTSIHTVSFLNGAIDSATTLEYSAYSKSTGGTASLYPLLVINVNTPLGPDTLSFDPHDQTSQTAQLNVWQTWTSAQNGFWRSSNFGAFSGGTLNDYLSFINIFGQGNVVTVATGPNSTGGIRLQAGPAGSGDVFDEYVDNFAINITSLGSFAYDFDPDPATNSLSQQFYNSTTVGTNPVGSPTILATNHIIINAQTPLPAGVGPNNWSVKLEGTFDMTASRYRFAASGASISQAPNDEIKMYVDGTLVLDKLPGQGPAAIAQMETAGIHTVRIDYIHATGTARTMVADFWKTSQCADMNGDNVVNSTDLGLVAAHYGYQDPNNPWDVNGSLVSGTNNYITNSIDLGIVAANFGKSCALTDINLK